MIARGMTAERTSLMSADRLGGNLGDLLDEIASESLSPAASSAAALSVALAAALTAKSARRSQATMESAAGVAAQGDSLRRRALALASENAEAYERAVATLPNPVAGDGARKGIADPERDTEIREALAGANDALSSLLEVACDVCLLAGLVAEGGEPGARADAAVAATQAEAGARAAVHLIEINLLSSGAEDVKAEARDALAIASEASGRALAAGS